MWSPTVICTWCIPQAWSGIEVRNRRGFVLFLYSYNKKVHQTRNLGKTECLGMVMCVCFPSIEEAEAEGSQFEGNPGYLIRPISKNKMHKEMRYKL